MQSLFVLLSVCVIASCKKARYEKLCGEKRRSSSFLWTMKRDPPVHFFGTIHVPYTRVWDYIPESSKKAFTASQSVVFELDLTDSQTRAALGRCQLLPRGTGLREVLPPDLYQRLKRHLNYVKKAMPGWVTPEQKIRGYYGKEMYDAIVGNWKRKKPIWVMLMINSLTEAGVRSSGAPVLDLHLARQAGRMGKKISAVEKVDEQCQPLNGLNISQVIFALNHTLMTLEKLRQGELRAPYTTDDLIKEYNCGELNAVMFDMESTQVPQMTNYSNYDDEGDSSKIESDTENVAMATDIDSYFKNELIYHRNQRMAERVKGLLKSNPDRSFFFAFGTGHFLGNGSVLDFLKQDGFEIHNVERANPSKRKRHFSRRRQRKRIRRQRAKKRRENQKQEIRNNLWIPIKNNDRKKSRIGHQGVNKEDHYLSFDESLAEVRVVNHYPTMLPSHLYEDWEQDEHLEKDAASSYPWSTYYAYSSKNQDQLSEDLQSISFKLWSSKTHFLNNGESGVFVCRPWWCHSLVSTLIVVIVLAMSYITC